MGNCCTKRCFLRRSSVVNLKKVTILMLGLDGAGKTTVAKRILKEPIENVLPTKGFANYNLERNGASITLYDVGGGANIRDIWKQYYSDVHGIVFVVDSQNLLRVEECRRALYSVLKHEKIAGKPVLLLANKQDLLGALDEIDLVEKLNLEILVNRQKCPTYVELCAAKISPRKTDLGIDSGMKWLLRYIGKNYSTLNNRVLVDVQAQAEADKIALSARRKRLQKSREHISEDDIILEDLGDPFKPIAQVVKPPHSNGIINHNYKSPIVVSSVSDLNTDSQNISDSEEDVVVAACSSQSELFFKSEDWGSTAGLVENIANGIPLTTCLVRPKSSGGNLDFPKKEKKRKKKKRLRLKGNNKTGPAPGVNGSTSGPIPAIFDSSYSTDVVAFAINKEESTNNSNNGLILDASKLL